MTSQSFLVSLEQTLQACPAVEVLYPGRGHEHLGNTRTVFERHYLDHQKIDVTVLMPESLLCLAGPSVWSRRHVPLGNRLHPLVHHAAMCLQVDARERS